MGVGGVNWLNTSEGCDFCWINKPEWCVLTHVCLGKSFIRIQSVTTTSRARDNYILCHMDGLGVYLWLGYVGFW